MIRNTKAMAAIVLTVLMLATACSSASESGSALGDAVGQGDGGASDAATDVVASFENESVSGTPLGLRLGEGTPVAQNEPLPPITSVEGEPLDDDRVDDIVDRLPVWVDDPADQVEFNRPDESLPAPTSGTRIESAFPPPSDQTTPEVATGPLEVLRFQPEGAVPVAPYVSVTFNQPMVPIGTLGQLDSADVPVEIDPDVPGHWEWIGTRTLRFEADSPLFDRLPMATSFRVEVPAGTESMAGNTLAEPVSWTFDTPTPTVRSLTPTGRSLDVEPVFVVSFDQTIDPAAVLETIELEAGGTLRDLRLATADEIAADDHAAAASVRLRDGRWLAFTPSEPLPTDTALDIRVGPLVPSIEGVETSDSVASFEARTYPPLSITEQACGRSCQPLQPFYLQFSNPLDENTFDESMVTVTPEPPGLTIDARWDSIVIRGATEGRTQYTVTLSGELTDVFGQTLGDDWTSTFDVEPADPFLGRFDQSPVIVDPMADDPALTLPMINHDRLRVRIYRVEPSDWDEFRRFESSLWDDAPIAPPGTELVDTELDVDAEEDVLTFLDIGLGEYFAGEPGHLVVVVSPTGDLAGLTRQDDLYRQNRTTTTWAQSTNIGLDAFVVGSEVIAWATALDSGEPLPGVDVELLPIRDNGESLTLTTGPDGTARGVATDEYRRLVGTLGDDTVWLEHYLRPDALGDAVRWYVTDDRGIYRPGEAVRMKGWVRELTLSDDGQLERFDTDGPVRWTVSDPRGNELQTGTSELSPLGGFDVEFELPAATNLGDAFVRFSVDGRQPGSQYDHGFQILEFRRPEFEVSARNETPGPYFATESATVAIEATYFSGGPLPNAAVDWTVSTTPTSYAPPNWDDFTFGIWTPWWYRNDIWFGDCFEGFCPGQGATEIEQLSGVTDSTGTHYLAIAFDSADQDRPSTVTANAAVMDVNRQVWASSTSLLVHSGRHYVGLAGERAFVRKGEPLEIEAIVTDVDGAAVAERAVDVVAEVLTWKRVDGEWQEVPLRSETCSLTSTTEPQSCTFDTELGGKYRVTAIVTDDSGGQNRTELTRWVSGGSGQPSQRVEQQQIDLVPDKETYAPGDTAEILVQSPFGAADGLLILTRNGVEETAAFRIEEDTTILSIDIEDRHIPNLDVRVELAGTTPRVGDDGEPLESVPERPAYASGALHLRIPPVSRTLDVVATPAEDTVEPGVDTTVDVQVVDTDGDPVEGAELLLVVVDEAVLALSDFELADPIETFYRDLQTNVQAAQSRRLIRLTNTDLLGPDTEQLQATAEAADSGDDAMEDEAASEAPSARSKSGDPIDVRSNFDALAVFEPELQTDADGRATLSFTMPDSLTRYRVMAVAVVDDDRFGSGESNITARLPLQVRPSAPRFLNFGDVFELPIVVQNQTDDEMVVDVVVETSNLELTGPGGKQVTVPANDRIEVRFPARAVEAGTARFRASAVSAEHADSAAVSLPVYTPATSEAFATYGVIDNGAVFQPLVGPEDVWPQFGGLEINTSSTALQALTDAVIYVHEYDYSSSDAAASQILSIASLREVLDAFESADLPSDGELDAEVRAAITTLVGLQNGDGGFPFWSRNRESVPYNSVHVAHALVVARQRGYDVPEGTLASALQYLRQIEDRFPSEYTQLTRDTIASYALYVRELAGNGEPARAHQVWVRSGGELSLDALGWLWPTVTDEAIELAIERRISNAVTETAAGATFANDYSDDDYVLLHSDRRTDGIVLGSLITKRPESDLIPKVVDGLLANKTKGRWGNLQENTFILLALHDYFVTYEDVEPNFVAQVWLGGTYAAEHAYQGRTTAQNDTLVPMSVLVDEGDTNVVVRKNGPGRLYYRLGLDYAPQSLELAPLDRGFVVQRTFEPVNDPDDVTQDGDGIWRVRAGAEVRVRVTMVADSRRTHVALVDPLPAGLEALNPALANSEELLPDPGSDAPIDRGSWYWWRWFTHENLRDDRAEAFAPLVRAGTYEYSYVARATTPGTFVVPPAKAEEMYAPETFGRSATDQLIVEAG